MIVPEDEIKKFCDRLRAAGRRLVFTNGCFDLLHAGHVRYLQSARAFGDYLIVGLNSDASVRALKGDSRPINGERDRAEVLSALRAVDDVVIFGDATAENLIRKVKPDVYVKGGDYTLETLPEAKIVQSYGGAVELVSLVEGRSSSAVIERIRAAGEGDV